MGGYRKFLAYRKRSYGWVLVHESSENGDDWTMAVDDPVHDLRERLGDLADAEEIVDVDISGASPRAIERVMGLISFSPYQNSQDG
jgi:hypothetical protein